MKKSALLTVILTLGLCLVVSAALAAQLTLSSNAKVDQLTVGTGDKLIVGAKNLEISGATDIDGELNIGGGLLPGGVVDANGTFDANGGTVGFNGPGELKLGGTVTSLGTIENNVSSTVTYDGEAQDVAAGTYYNLTTGASGTKTLGGDVTVEKTLTTGSGTTFALDSHTLNIGDTWTNSGNFSAGTGTVTYNKAGAQNVLGESYYNLTVEGGNTKTLAGAASVGNTLTLTSGLLSLGNYDLSLTDSATAVAGSLSASNMVVIDGNGVLKKEFSSSGSFIFPVGETTGTAQYSPATLNITSGTFSSGWAAVKVMDAKQPDNTSTTDYLTRYWTITSGGITSFSCNANFSYVDADIEGTEDNIHAGKYSGSNWSVGNAVTSSSNQVSMTVSEFSDFTGVKKGSTPTTQAQSITFSNVNETTMTVGWTRGNGNEVLVVAHGGAAVDSNPVNGATYTANAAFGSGSQIGTGNYVVYQGAGTSVAITGLTQATTYHFQVFELDNTGIPVTYNATTGGATAERITVEGASKVVLTGPATILKDGLGAYTLTTNNSSDEVKNVNQDTTFTLNSSGTGTFYSDAVGTTVLPSSQITIASGASTVTFYYRDNTFGTPTLTASVQSGQSLTSGTKQIRVAGNNALSFDGTDDYVHVGTGPNEVKSIEFWVYPKPSMSGNYLINLNDDDDGIGVNTQGLIQASGLTNPTIYVDGVQTNELYNNKWQHVAVTTTTGVNASNLDIGMYQGDYANCTMDEVRFWSDVRTPDEIRANMHRELQGNEAGLAGYYKFDTGTGTTAYDSSTGGNDGTLTGGPYWQTSGAMTGPGNALDFDGTNDYVNIGDAASLRPTSTVSVEAWVNPGNISGDKALVAKFLPPANKGYSLEIIDGKPRFVVGNDGMAYAEASNAIIADKWHHLSGTYDGTTIRIYVDGVESSSQAYAGGIWDSANTPFYIGRRYLNNDRSFQGKMDEVRIWNTARTPAQIRDNMCTSLQGYEPGLVAYYRMDQKTGTTLYDVSPNANNGNLNNMDVSDWVASSAFNTWIGLSNIWISGYNWSRSVAPAGTGNAGIPDYSSTTGYPAGNTPTINGTPTVNHLVLATDAGSTLSSNLTLNGNLLLNSNFDMGTHTVSVAGSAINTRILSLSTGTLDCNGPYNASGGSTTFAGAGSLKLASTFDLGTFTKGMGTVKFDGNAAQTITGDLNVYNLTIDNAAGVDASGATSLKVDNQLTVSSGMFTSASDYHHVIVTVNGGLTLSNDITVSGSWQFFGILNHNDHKVTLDGTNQSFAGDTIFYDLTKTVITADTLTFDAGSNTSVTHALTLGGAAGQLLSLRSTTPGTQWNINSSNTPTISYLDVKDSNNTSATNMGAEANNCVDSGNNDNWFNVTVSTVTTQAVTDIGTTSATGNGNITSLGSPNPTAHGVCWSTTANPTTADSKTDKGASTSTGAFTASITGLSSGTTYHVRAYATGGAGISYGDDMTFTTLTPSPPPSSPSPPSPASFVVTFNLDGKGTHTGGGALVQSVQNGLSASAPLVQAVAGYEFTGWNMDFSNVQTTMIVTAQYTARTFTLGYTGGTGGTIGGASYQTVKYGASGSPVTATPLAGYQFVGWSDGSNANPRTDTNVISNISVNAVFSMRTYQLTVQGGSGDGTYNGGSVVTISAGIAPEGQIFHRWTDPTSNISNVNLANTTITMPMSDVVISALYRERPVEKFVLAVDSGTGDGEYNAGRTVSIAATPAEKGMMFHRWTGQTANVANVNIPNTTVTMPEAGVHIGAVYKTDPMSNFVLEIRIETKGDGAGTNVKSSMRTLQKVEETGEGIPAGQLFILTAPDSPEGYIFDKWTGQTAYITNVNLPVTSMYMPDEDVVVIATYRRLPAEVILSVENGSGSGTYPPANPVTIMAEPAPDGKLFDKWTGQTSNVVNINLPETVIVMPGVDVMIQAVYCEMPGEVFVLGVVNGSGSGSYPAGSFTKIMANPAPKGYKFDKWQGQNATVEDILSPETFVFMPPNEAMIIATYTETEDTEIVPDNLVTGSLVLINDAGYLLSSGSNTVVYGSSAANYLIIENGATAKCLSFPGKNIFSLASEAQMFTVFRSGTSVTLEGPDHTSLVLPATTTGQTIVFSDGAAVLKIMDDSVWLGNQLVTTSASPVVVELTAPPEITEHPSGDIENPDAYLFFVGGTSCTYTMGKGSSTQIYGNATLGTLHLESGAAVMLDSLSNANTFSIGSNAELFMVSRFGATVTLSGSDGTLLIVEATLVPKQIRFLDRTLDLVIESGKIMLGEQVVEIESTPVVSVTGSLVLMNDVGYMLSNGSRTEVYSSSQSNYLIIENGATAKCLSFPGKNIFSLASESLMFTVSRSGTSVTLEGPDHTSLVVPATTTGQTIVFPDGAAVLKIMDDSVWLGNQLITTSASPVVAELTAAPEIIENPSGDIENPDAYIFFVGGTSCTHTMRQGSSTQIYGTATMDTLYLESGAAVMLDSLSNANTFFIGSNAELFMVSRFGATVTLSGSDGTLLIVDATLAPKQIRFLDRTLNLVIESGKIMLGEQVVEIEPAPVAADVKHVVAYTLK